MDLPYLFKSVVIIFLASSLFVKNLHSFQGHCQFEEVYSNGEIQQGSLWYQEQNFRYEYENQNLFTIIKNNRNTYIINNHNKVYHLYDDPYNIITTLIEVFESKETDNFIYENEDLKIILEERQNSEFIKRIAVISPNANFSIYLNDCISKKFPEKIFKHFPFVETNNVL